MTFPINPYSFQSSPNSNISTSMSVCSLLHQGCGPLSRSLFGAVQLLNHKHTSHGNKAEYLPCTPAMNNTCKHCLLWIISDVCKVWGYILLSKSDCQGIARPQVSPCPASGSQVSWLVKNVKASNGTCRMLHCHDWCYQLERYTVSSELHCEERKAYFLEWVRTQQEHDHCDEHVEHYFR